MDSMAALGAWFAEWNDSINAVDYGAARRLFHPDVVGFGTHMPIVHGLEHLEREQWRNVWPTITDFRFRVRELEGGISEDGTLGWAMVPWISTGYQEDGTTFARPGRATVILVRDDAQAPWRAMHTHISLAPGVPPRSYGPHPAG